MFGCLVGLTYTIVTAVFTVIFRIVGMVLMMMAMSVGSLFVGVDTAIDRIAFSWIEQATGDGIQIGYNPVARDGVRMAAGLVLVMGWILDIGLIYLIVSIVANG
jgi:hypothetical protein